MDGHVQAIVAAQGHRCVYQRHFAQRRALVQVFVVDRLARGYPPCGGLRCDGELGQFVIDDRFAQVRLLGEYVAEPQAVVVDAEHQVQPALAAGGFGQVHGQFVEVVAGETALAPRLFPAVVDTATFLRQQAEVAVEATITQFKTQLRIGHHGLAEALDAVACGAAVQHQADLQYLVR
ncbi:hypothetical protein D3C72_1136990 [compost metagenome]